jgi:hypothetical protein
VTSERRHSEPPRRRARSPQGERVADERHRHGALIRGAASSPEAAHAGSVRAGPKASRDLVGTPASHARRRWAAQGEPGKFSFGRRPSSVCLLELGLGLGFRGFALGVFLGSFQGCFFS